jgi:hypothetical protein
MGRRPKCLEILPKFGRFDVWNLIEAVHGLTFICRHSILGLRTDCDLLSHQFGHLQGNLKTITDAKDA